MSRVAVPAKFPRACGAVVYVARLRFVSGEFVSIRLSFLVVFSLSSVAWSQAEDAGVSSPETAVTPVVPATAAPPAGPGEVVPDAGVAAAPLSPVVPVRPVTSSTPVATPALAPPPPVKPAAPEPPSPPLDLGFLLPITPALSSLHYDFSAVYSHVSTGFAEGGFAMTGLRFTERNSGLGKMLMYVTTQLLLAAGEGMAASQGKHVGTTYHPGYRVDYYRPYSSSELANMRAAREQAGDDLLHSNMSLDLQLYLPVAGRSTASGISAEITPVTVEFTDDGTIGLELAFQYAKFTDVQAGDPAKLRSFEYVGTPLRLMANWRFVQLQLQWAPNFIGGFGVSPKVMEQKYAESVERGGNLLYTNSPWTLSMSVHPLKWVFVRATGAWTKYEFNVNALGYQLEAGLRF